MEIKIDCYCRNKESKYLQLINITLTEEDIFQMLMDRFKNDELPLPMYLNREEITPEFSIDSVTV